MDPIASPPDRTRAVYVISVAAELAGVHAQTLRINEPKGLDEPARTPPGSRRYSEIDIALLRRIQELTNEGLNLAGVKRVLDLEHRVAQLEAEMRELQAAAAATVIETHRQYRRDLVPLQQSVVPWLDPQRRRR